MINNCTLLPELFYYGLPCFIEKNRSGGNRVENIGLWIKIAQVSKSARLWVFCSPEGPFKLSKERVEQCLPSNEITLRVFLGLLNKVNKADLDAAFQYLEQPDRYPEMSALANFSPFLKHFDGSTLLYKAIYNHLRGKGNQTVLKFFFNQVSLEEFMEPLRSIQFYSNESHLITILDVFFDETEERCGSDLPARCVLQSLLEPISSALFGGSSTVELFIDWMIDKELKFDLPFLSKLTAYNVSYRENRLLILEKIMDYQPELFTQSNFIHTLLNANQGDRYLKSCLELFLSKFPDELEAEDANGKKTFIYLFENEIDLIIKLDKQYISPELLLRMKEDILESLLCSYDVDYSKVLKIIPEEWLSEPYGDDHKFFPHEILKRSFREANKMLAWIQGSKGVVPKYLKLIDVMLGDDCNAINEILTQYSDLKDHVFSYFNDCLLGSWLHRGREDYLPKLEQIFGPNWIHYQDQNGDTCLHHLFSKLFKYQWSGYTEYFVFLMDNGFDPDVENNAGLTINDLASINGWNDYLHLLK